MGIYNRQSADDFSYAVLTHEAVVNGGGLLDLLAAAWETNQVFFHNWQGLYSSAFLLALQPAIFGEKLYALTPVIIIALAYLFTFGAVHILNRRYLQRSTFFSVTASLALVTVLMLWLPSPTEGIYWYNGAMNYMPWAFSNLFNLCFLLHIKDHTSTWRGRLELLMSTLLSFLTSGGNHVTAFANILFLLIASVYWLMQRRTFSLWPFAAACIGFIIMYTAPGTAIRAASCEQQPVLDTILAVIVHLFTQVTKWFNLHWLLSLLLITPIGIEIVQRNRIRLPKGFVLLSMILSTGVLCGMLAVPYFSIGNFGASRTTNVIWITFLFLSWFNYVLVLLWLNQRNRLSCLAERIRPVQTLIMVACLLLLFLFPSRNGFSSSVRAVKELNSGTAQAYAAEWDERHRLINDSTLDEVWVTPLSHKSYLLFFSDLFIGDSTTTSQEINDYYGKSIYMQR